MNHELVRLPNFKNICVVFEYACPKCQKFTHIVLPYFRNNDPIHLDCSCGEVLAVSLVLKDLGDEKFKILVCSKHTDIKQKVAEGKKTLKKKSLF